MAKLKGKFLDDIFEQVTPSGTINSSNASFTLPSLPHSNKSVLLFINGIMQRQGLEYTISGSTITMTAAPQAGSDIFAWYVKR
jgi:hypothetical protein